MGVIKFSGWYTPELCRKHTDKVFIFGDNTLGFGKGGQAIIRDEPNALGVPTKRKPSMTEDAFFAEGSAKDEDAVLVALGKVWAELKMRKTVVIPVTPDGRVSLGLERAELPKRSPSLYKLIETHVQEMCDAYGVTDAKQFDAA